MAQRHFWLLDRITGGHPVYTMPRRYRIRGTIDAVCLERALGEVARRHEILRTRLPERGNGPVQEVLRSHPFRLPIVDLSAGTEAERPDRLQALEAEASRRPFDLAERPAWRAVLARLGTEDHVLVLAHHHSIFDGWSRPLLDEELGACYRAFARGVPTPLDPLPLQYADFAEWEQERISDERLDPLLDWWAERLKGLPVVDLLCDRPRPAGTSFDGACHCFEVPPVLGRRLRDFATARRATPFMALLAAFNAILHRITGAVDLPVGCPTAGRAMPGSEALIGCFVNPVVMRGDVSGDPSFEELVDRVRRVTLDCLTHAEMRFERLVERLSPARVQGMNPLFQVLFQVLAFPPSTLSLGDGTDVESSLIDRRGATVDLAWSLVSEGDGFMGQVEYATALFQEPTVRGLAGRFVALLQGALEVPTARISELPILSPSERQRILVEWNGTSTPYPRDRSIVDLFADQVHRDPEATAIAVAGLTMSYAELARRADRLAGALIEAGVGRETPVGLCMDRSPEMIVGMLAALRAGGAYVPLDPGYPDERLAFMVEDAGIGAIVVGPGMEARGFGPAVTVLGCDAGSDTALSTAPGADDLAYVLYTSGSTGTAKGVAVEHRAVVRLVRATDYVSIGPADRVAHASHPSFDATTFEVWGALLNGAAVVVLDQDTTLEPPRLARELSARSVSVLFLTTALFNAVADEVPDAFRTVRTVMFGGEAVDPARVRKVLAEGPPERLLHVYGPTECTTFATWHRVTEVPPEAATVPIGRPIANTRAWVVDPHGQPVPPGVPGELLLGGDGLARGYHGGPDLTRQRFVHAAFGTGERVYRTGDKVRREDDGAIVFLGRLDRQVKVRGFRIEPGEVEAALGRHPSVRECVVAPREAGPGGRRLVAWIVPEGDAPSSAGMSAFLSARLPRYMLPSAYAVVDAMPLNRNGKVDVNALPDPPAPVRAEAPLTETEVLLAEVWRETLGVSEVGRTDDFYDLGGHSLLAVRLFSEIEQRTGRRLPVSIFDHGLTIAAVAECLERESTVAGTDFVVPIRSGGPRPPLFLVHGGGGHVFVYRWLASHLDGDRPVFGFNLKGIRRADLPRTVQQMAERYLRDLEVAWPEGPCLLGGYSFGGVVAWEMARGLQARGRTVPLLVLLEATDDLLLAHRAPVRAWRKARRAGGQVVRGLADLARTRPSQWSSIVSRRFETARPALWDRPPDPREETADEAAAMMATSRWAVRHYRPGRYAGRTLYFRAAGQVWRPLVWSSYADDLDVVMLPGEGHESFLREENAPIVAEVLDARLREADGG
jgi:amino acid adenylation domain-containing protein